MSERDAFYEAIRYAGDNDSPVLALAREIAETTNTSTPFSLLREEIMRDLMGVPKPKKKKRSSYGKLVRRRWRREGN
jgi:hypothetical protein